MANLNFGVSDETKKKKKFTIDGDKNRVIEIDTSDTGVITRYNDSKSRIDEFVSRMDELVKDDSKVDFIEGFAAAEKEMREIIDYIFASPVCEPIFGKSSVFSPSGGSFAFEKVIAGLLKEYETDITKGYAGINKANIAKHTDKYTKK